VAAAVGPAVNEYSESFPNPKGSSYAQGAAPTADPSELGPVARHLVSQSPDGKLLATIATAPQLGGSEASAGGTADPDSGDIVSGETPSVLTAAVRTLDDPPVLVGLLALLALIGGLGFLVRADRTRNDT
jgi:hypothetical protein